MELLIKNGTLVNEGNIFQADILIKNGFIQKIAPSISNSNGVKEINAEGKYIIPGIIDDQVHFREPGLTHKANIYTEAKAGVAGGVTSFMEMPNTNPPATTRELLEDKYKIAAQTSLANYSFFMGTTNDNADEVLNVDPENVCGIKIFMGSSTGNMLVEDQQTLERIFANAPAIIAIHSENDKIVAENLKKFKEKYGEDLPVSAHPEIRNVEACYKMTEYAVELAKKFNTKLHILHISTEEELSFFRNDIPMEQKRITSEVCVHHLYFNSEDYSKYGNQIKCNPAIKEKRHQQAIFKAMMDDRIDIIATDHAPHTWDEKSQQYVKAPAGVPLLQHSLNVMLDFYNRGMISFEKIVEKMCHKPAMLFDIDKRGFLKEGYWADIAIVDLNYSWLVDKSNILYKCNWSPFEGHTFKGKVTHTIVSGNLVYDNGVFNEEQKGKRLRFNRN